MASIRREQDPEEADPNDFGRDEDVVTRWTAVGMFGFPTAALGGMAAVGDRGGSSGTLGWSFVGIALLPVAVALPILGLWPREYGYGLLGAAGLSIAVGAGFLAYPDPAHARNVAVAGLLVGGLATGTLGGWRAARSARRLGPS